MALVIKDRVKDTSTTSGTGSLTLSGTAPLGFQTFGAAIGGANTTYYAIVDSTTGDWEVGLGTYTSASTSLSRDTVYASSNSGSLVSFATNNKDVFVTYPAGRSIYKDSSGNVYIPASQSVRFNNGTNSNYVGFTGGVTTTSVTWVLPVADGSNGQLITTNGSATLSWSNGVNLGTIMTTTYNFNMP